MNCYRRSESCTTTSLNASDLKDGLNWTTYFGVGAPMHGFSGSRSVRDVQLRNAVVARQNTVPEFLESFGYQRIMLLLGE